jgi:D-aspartate ligase
MGHIARVHEVRDRLIIVDDDQQLAAGLERTLDAGIDVLLTELVSGGPGSSCSLYTYLTPEGAPLFQVNKRSHRQFPIRFGLTTYHETVDEPEVTELGLRFFRSIGLVGVGNVEFKQDARDGQWRLIECNHRFTAANELIRRAGVDIALIAYLRAAGRPAPPVNSYRTGLWMWHPLEDLRALPAYRRSGEVTLRGWLRSLAHRQHFQLMRWNDPLPSLVSLARKIPQAARRLRRS